MVSGTEGYADEAEALLQQYESVRFGDVHRQMLHLFPTVPGRILDIGAGTGRDAAAFAAMAHRVLAVEPTAALRTRAALLHPSPEIEWLDDSLPDLAYVTRRGETFDVVMLTAVWMHLDAAQRRRAMPNVAALLRHGGLAALTLRHGPVPAGRRMFEVSATETVKLASRDGLAPILRLENQSGRFGRAGVTWTRLAFVKRS